MFYRLGVAPPFSVLCWCAQGHGFKQWTGDDSKALMKVGLQVKFLFVIFNEVEIYLPAIQGHLPCDIVHTFCMFLEFCYTTRHDVITENDLSQLHDALT